MYLILIVFISKLLDCSFSVLKNIYLIKGKYFFSALCASISVVFFIYTAQQTGVFAYIAIGIATFLGNYLPPVLVNKIEKDKLYTYNITSDTLNNGKVFADQLRELNIPVATTKVFNNKMEPVLLIIAYSNTKLSSKIIENNIPVKFKYNISESLSIDK